MKILVSYMSETGNTQKVAEAIFQEIAGKREIKKLDELDSLEGYDFSFIGLPIQAFGPAAAAKKFLQRHAAGCKMALFITHAVPEDHPELSEWLHKCRKAAEGAEIVGLFDCQGELSSEIMEFLKTSDDPKMLGFGERGAETKGQPDENRLQKARAFAREILTELAT